MVEFVNVKKSYGQIVALEDVSFSIDPGEFVFIVGPSGAGKTTILKLLIAQTRPTSGRIHVDGQAIQSLKKSQIPKFRQKIGVVFQDFKLLPERTISENIEVVLAVAGIQKKEWHARVDQVLKLVGLSERSDLFPSQLSGGELQRAAIARALVINPKVIFADEPTGNLDWKTAESIVDLLEKIHQEGKTIVVTSHNQEIINKMKKRIIEIENGRVKKDSKHAGHTS